MIKDTSFKHRLRLRLGYTYVPYQTVLPLIKGGEVQGFVQPGYYRLSRLFQSYGEPIPTGFRFRKAENIVAHTTDGIEVKINVSLKYIFNPGKAQPKFIPGIAKLNKFRLLGLVEDFLARAVRLVCGQLPEVELANGRTWPHLDRQIRHELQRNLTPFGLLFSGQSAINITNIKPPPEIEQERNAAQCHAIYAAALNRQPADIADQLHEQKLAHHSDYVHLSIGSNGEPEQPYPLPIVNGLQYPYQPSNGRLHPS